MSHFEAVVIAGHHWNPCVNKPNSVVLISLEGSSWNSDDTLYSRGRFGFRTQMCFEGREISAWDKIGQIT